VGLKGTRVQRTSVVLGLQIAGSFPRMHLLLESGGILLEKISSSSSVLGAVPAPP